MNGGNPASLGELALVLARQTARPKEFTTSPGIATVTHDAVTRIGVPNGKSEGTWIPSVAEKSIHEGSAYPLSLVPFLG